MTNLDTNFQLSPFGDFLGIEQVSSDDTKSLCRMSLSSSHFNAGGRVHGGVLSSLADTAAGLVVRVYRPEHSVSATTDLSIAFIRSPLKVARECKSDPAACWKKALSCRGYYRRW